MNHKIRYGWTTAVLIGLGLLVAGGAGAQSGNAIPTGDPLEGSWDVVVTLTDCATGNPLPVPPFHSLVTFSRGGTIIESSGSLAFAPNQRSIGHGLWTHEPGQTYGQHVVALILFDNNPQTVPPLFAGWQTIDHTVTLTDSDTFTSAGTAAFYKFDGQRYRQGCSTAVGRRFSDQ